jgi:hypothetical protein
MTQKSIMDPPELACFTCSAAGLTNHDARKGPPPGGELLHGPNSLVTVSAELVDDVIRFPQGLPDTEVNCLNIHPNASISYSARRLGPGPVTQSSFS